MSRAPTFDDFSYTGSPEHPIDSDYKPTTIPTINLKLSHVEDSARLISLQTPEPNFQDFYHHQPTPPSYPAKDWKSPKKDDRSYRFESNLLRKVSIKREEPAIITPGTIIQEKCNQIIRLYGTSFNRSKSESLQTPILQSLKLSTRKSTYAEKASSREAKPSILEIIHHEKQPSDNILLPPPSNQPRGELKSPKTTQYRASKKNFDSQSIKAPVTPQHASKRLASEKNMRTEASPSMIKGSSHDYRQKESYQKIIDVLSRENRASLEKASPKYMNQSPLNFGTPRELPLLNLNKASLKNRAYSLAKPSFQGLSSRVLRADTEETSHNNDGPPSETTSERFRLNFGGVHGQDKNALISTERSIKHYTFDEKHDTTPSGEIHEGLNFLQKHKELELAHSNVRETSLDMKASKGSQQAKVRSPKKVLTFTEGKPVMNLPHKELSGRQNSAQLSHKQTNSAKLNSEQLGNIVESQKAEINLKSSKGSAHKAELIKNKSTPGNVGKMGGQAQELTPEQRYEKIMKSNIQDRFNEIFRSLRSKKKTKKVKFSCDIRECECKHAVS